MRVKVSCVEVVLLLEHRCRAPVVQRSRRNRSRRVVHRQVRRLIGQMLAARCVRVMLTCSRKLVQVLVQVVLVLV